MMRCIIIEDQPPAQRILKKYIADLGTLNLVGTFPDAIQALTFCQKEPVDLIFLDIHLPKISGMEFLKTLVHPPHIILTTAFPDYALESYEFNVVDYLLKPFSFQRFVQAVTKIESSNTAPASAENSKPAPIFVKSGYEHIKIRPEEILYIRSDADYTEIHLPQQRYLSQWTLQEWLDHLDPSTFMRIHKSYILQIEHIEKVSGNQVTLAGGIHLPIGRVYKEAFRERILGHS